MENRVNNKDYTACLVAMIIYWALLAAGLIFTLAVLKEITEQEVIAFTVGGVFAAFLTFFGVVGTPRFYTFSEEGLTMHFLFGFYKHYAWKSVRAISATYSFNQRRFVIDGEASGKTAFFTELSHSVPVTDKSRELMQKYWKKEYKSPFVSRGK